MNQHFSISMRHQLVHGGGIATAIERHQLPSLIDMDIGHVSGLGIEQDPSREPPGLFEHLKRHTQRDMIAIFAHLQSTIARIRNQHVMRVIETHSRDECE